MAFFSHSCSSWERTDLHKVDSHVVMVARSASVAFFISIVKLISNSGMIDVSSDVLIIGMHSACRLFFVSVYFFAFDDQIFG